MQSESLYSWSANKLFWSLNLIGWSVYLVILVLLELDDSVWEVYKALLKTVKLLMMFSFCILFRHLCSIFSWPSLAIKKLLGVTLGYALACGTVTAAGSMLILRSIADKILPAADYQMAFGEINWTYVLNEFYWTSLSCTFITSTWLVAYVSIVLYHKKQSVELENLRLANAVKEAQLSALRHQLNPHFLFNALNNIRALVRDNKPEAVDMITAISEILKSLFTVKYKDKILLSEEMETIGYLLDIARIQYGEKMRYTQQVDKNTLRAKIPALAIQVLIENAIKHGLEVQKEGCDIHLSIEKQGSLLNIQLSNSGTLSPNIRKTTSVGLVNLRQRLKLLYEDEASFTLKHVSDQVIAQITLPCEIDG